MRNFYLSCKFCTLTINLSEVVLPGHIPLQIIVFGKERLRNVLNASQRRVNKNSLTWWYILKTSWRCLEDVLKMSSKRLEDVLKTYLQDVLKTCWKRLEDVLARRLEDVLKTSWSQYIAKANILVLTKTSWRRLHQDEYLLGRFYINLFKSSGRKTITSAAFERNKRP